MKNKNDVNVLYEQKIITKCILNGMSLKQISQKLHCAKSTASYKTRKLFENYDANDRHEFIINLFSKIITKYKNKIALLEDELKNKTY